MYQRTLKLPELVKRKSLFLFGPRSTGKTTLLRQNFPDHAIINLLRSQIYLTLAERPGSLRDMAVEIGRTSPVVVIDEIQKLPGLLDEVHDLIETTRLHFILTGSSARKLRQGGVNLLAGRAWQTRLFPLTSAELTDFNLDRYLLHGGLPQVWTSPEPIEELDAYVNTYLKEEIQAESLVQNLSHFARFLKVAALANAEQVNFANMSRDTGVPATTVRAWFDILADTFTGFLLEPWRDGTKRKAVATAKFYFFDLGVANHIAGFNTIPHGSTEFGKVFEHFIALELRAWIDYTRRHETLSYWRTSSGQEVDFVLGQNLAVEAKATSRISDHDLKGLRALREEGLIRHYILVSLDEADRQTPDGIRLLHWRSFLTQLWNETLLESGAISKTP
jgi:predicted AAA+ superfamily ATPase